MQLLPTVNWEMKEELHLLLEVSPPIRGTTSNQRYYFIGVFFHTIQTNHNTCVVPSAYPSHPSSHLKPWSESVYASVLICMSTSVPGLPHPFTYLHTNMWTTLCMSQPYFIWSHILVRRWTCISIYMHVHLTPMSALPPLHPCMQACMPLYDPLSFPCHPSSGPTPCS